MASIIRSWHDLLTAAHAWQIDPRDIAPPELRTRCLSWLSSDERAHYESIGSERLRHDYLCARSLCRATLSHYTSVDPPAWRFATNARGKPRILRPAIFKTLRFNLTHTNGLMICLVSRAGAVGVDAEETSRVVDVEQIARHFASGREQLRLRNLDGPKRRERFFEQWVLREAYLKATGRGIASAAERFAIARDADVDAMRAGTWQFSIHRASSNHVAAAAVRRHHATDPIAVHWLRADGLLP
jgi:4'-phosphopantetheinyl transferase